MDIYYLLIMTEILQLMELKFAVTVAVRKQQFLQEGFIAEHAEVLGFFTTDLTIGFASQGRF